MTFPAIRQAIFFAAAAFVTLSFAPRTFAQATPEVKRTVLLRHDTQRRASKLCLSAWISPSEAAKAAIPTRAS
jgi:hypothetical protein